MYYDAFDSFVSMVANAGTHLQPNFESDECPYLHSQLPAAGRQHMLLCDNSMHIICDYEP